MSNDSFNKSKERRDRKPLLPSGIVPPQKWLHSSWETTARQEEGVSGRGRFYWLKPQKDWGVIAGALVAAVALLGPLYILEPFFKAVFPLIPVSSNIKVALATSLIELCSLGIIIAALVAYGKKPRAIGFTRITRQHVFAAAAGFVGYFAVSFAIYNIARLFIDANQPQDLGYTSLSTREIITAFVPIVILTPLAEETIFRGFLFKGFRKHLPFWLSALGVSVLFGLAHGQWNVGLDVFVLSLVSCYLVERTNSLWPSIFLHAIKNGLAFWILYIYNGG